MNGQVHSKKLDYTWVIVGLCLLIMITGTGFVGNRSMYISAICDALDIKRSVFSIGDSIRFLTTAVINLFFGALVAKLGTKKLICAGFISYICSMTLYSLADRVWMFYVAAFLMGVGVAWVGTTMVGSIINKWCKVNTGTITGFVMASTGLGSAIAAQVTTPIIMGSEFGYKTAYRLVAASLVVALIVVTIFYKEKQEYAPASHKKKKFRGRAWEGLSFSETTKKPYFYIGLVCIFLTGFCVQGFVSVTGSHMRDVGMDADFISWVMMMHSIVFIFCKFGAGLMYDRFGLRITASVCTIAAVATLFMMSMYSNTNAGRICAVVSQVVSSFAIPLETVMLTIFAGDLFGQKAYDKIVGIFVACNVFGYAVGVPVVNVCYDIFGSYSGVLAANGIVMAVVFVTWQFIITSAHKIKKEVEQSSLQEVQ